MLVRVKLRQWGLSCLLAFCILLVLQGHKGYFWSTTAAPRGRKLNEDIDDKGIPLTTEFYDGGMRLLVDVQPQHVGGDWLPKQRLLLDTGSSTLAFCNRQLIVAAQYEASNLMSCNEYNPGGNFSGYWGPFVTGDIRVGHETWKMSSYSIMVQEKGMPCTEGIDGIFGIAFGQLDPAFPAESQTVTSKDNFSCPPNSSHDVLPPLMRHLLRESSQKIGIFWAAGKKDGRLYMGQSAVDNEHYAQNQHHAMTADLVEKSYYNIEVQTIAIGSETFNVNCDPASSTCIMDTGTPAIVLPEDIYEAAIEQNGTMAVELAASDSSINLTLDIGLLNFFGWIVKGSEESGLILGLPLWAFYYTVFDIKANQVVFVPISDAEQADHRRQLI